MSTYEQYDHHGTKVWVRADLKGTHRNHCLCWSCDKLKPGSPENCSIAKDLYANCVKHNVVSPVFECPAFKRKEAQ